MGGSGNRTAWLAWLESERRYGANTLAAYESDLDDYLGYAGGDAGSGPPDRGAFAAGWPTWPGVALPVPPWRAGSRR